MPNGGYVKAFLLCVDWMENIPLYAISKYFGGKYKVT